MGGGVGSGWGLGNFSSTFVLGTLEAGKHNVNNVNNVQCLITVSIGEILSPGEETLGGCVNLSPLLYIWQGCQTLNSTNIHVRPT